MKKLIYSTGVFETELTAYVPEEDPHYDTPFVARVRQQRFELRKTSRCLMRYEVEDGDKEYLEHLEELAGEATKMLSMNLISPSRCKFIVDSYNHFADLYDQAIHHFESEYKGARYIEIADETSNGCRAEYHFNDGVMESCFPCKIGEPLVIKINKPSI